MGAENASMSLDGKRAVILGGTSGNGLATAKAAQREGAVVVVVSSRQRRVDAALAALDTGAEGHVVDLSDEAQVRKFFEHIGAFDQLVYTAGELRWSWSLSTRCRLDRPRGFSQRHPLLGRVRRPWKYGSARVSGRADRSPCPMVSPGCARAKGWSTLVASICGAMEALTRALAVELAPIRVNAVCPGVVRTELWNDMTESDRDALYRNVAQSVPVGRVGEPEDLAQTYIYLMREGYSTGQVIVVDGGHVLV